MAYLKKDTGNLKGVFAVSNNKDAEEKLGKIAEKTSLAERRGFGCHK